MNIKEDILEDHENDTDFKEDIPIHSKSGTIGGANFTAQKNWRKKCVNRDKNILR